MLLEQYKIPGNLFLSIMIEMIQIFIQSLHDIEELQSLIILETVFYVTVFVAMKKAQLTYFKAGASRCGLLTIYCRVRIIS